MILELDLKVKIDLEEKIFLSRLEVFSRKEKHNFKKEDKTLERRCKEVFNALRRKGNFETILGNDRTKV